MASTHKHMAEATLDILRWHPQTLLDLIDTARTPPWRVVRAVADLMRAGDVVMREDGVIVPSPASAS